MEKLRDEIREDEIMKIKKEKEKEKERWRGERS
jgi:hypothetical protein